MNNKTKIMLVILCILLISLVVTAKKIENNNISRTNQTRIDNNYKHQTVDIGRVINYTQENNITIITFDSGWRVFTSTNKFNKLTR